jgi:hypothetical protein
VYNVLTEHIKHASMGNGKICPLIVDHKVRFFPCLEIHCTPDAEIDQTDFGLHTACISRSDPGMENR